MAGRPQGSPNRNTKQSREAIARFIDESIPQFKIWLELVASGIPRVNQQGQIIYDNDGATTYVKTPDPLGAMKIVSDIAEYHLPKLSRSEATVTVDNPNLKTLTIDELLQLKQELEQENTTMAEMTLAEIEQELERRNGLATDDLLTIGMQLFRANPEQLIEKSPSFANKLLELEARRLEIEAATHFSGNLEDYSTAQLKAHLYEGVQPDDFFTLCQNGVDHLMITRNPREGEAFMLFLRAYVK